MRNMIWAVNTTSQVLSSGTTIPLGSTVRRSGCGCTLNGNTVEVTGKGYYKITANVVGSATADGLLGVTILKNGTAITGATSQEDVAAGDVATLPVFAVIRQPSCPCLADTEITLQWSGAAGTLESASIEVESL